VIVWIHSQLSLAPVVSAVAYDSEAHHSSPTQLHPEQLLPAQAQPALIHMYCHRNASGVQPVDWQLLAHAVGVLDESRQPPAWQCKDPLMVSPQMQSHLQLEGCSLFRHK